MIGDHRSIGFELQLQAVSGVTGNQTCKRLARILFQRFVNIVRSVSSEDRVTMLREICMYRRVFTIYIYIARQEEEEIVL